MSTRRSQGRNLEAASKHRPRKLGGDRRSTSRAFTWGSRDAFVLSEHAERRSERARLLS